MEGEWQGWSMEGQDEDGVNASHSMMLPAQLRNLPHPHPPWKVSNSVLPHQAGARGGGIQTLSLSLAEIFKLESYAWPHP